MEMPDGSMRSQNRLISDCFVMFNAENLRKLKEELNDIDNKPCLPKGLRIHDLNEEEEDMCKPLQKELLRTWFSCDYQFAQAISSGFLDKNPGSNFDIFWNDLYEYSLVWRL